MIKLEGIILHILSGASCVKHRVIVVVVLVVVVVLWGMKQSIHPPKGRNPSTIFYPFHLLLHTVRSTGYKYRKTTSTEYTLNTRTVKYTK